jgi:hypothetical protein
MQYKAPRRFTAKDENCTYTIRVPRKFLSEENREKFCAFKYLFGTEIFTDDSCPISAAIHSGWIRGYWGSDIDENLMDLPPPAPEDEPVPDNVTQVPKAPIVPPPKKDAQITILVLPRLEKYASTLRFGVRSRPWGNNHDGVSFMILGIKFVDHSPSSEVEWTGEGRRKRMLADFESRDLFRGAMVPAKRLETSALVEASAA